MKNYSKTGLVLGTLGLAILAVFVLKLGFNIPPTDNSASVIQSLSKTLAPVTNNLKSLTDAQRVEILKDSNSGLAIKNTKTSIVVTKPTVDPKAIVKQTKEIPFDLAIPDFSTTKEGKAYIKMTGGLPLIHDAWEYPVRSNAYQKYNKQTPTRKVSFLQKVVNFFTPSKALASPVASGLPGQYDCKPTSSTTGYFKVSFEDMAVGNNIGYADPAHGLARRNEVCSVLEDIAHTIGLDTTTVTPDIIFAVAPSNMPANALAAASAYSGYESTPGNGSLHKHIITHIDPTPGAGNFDAFVYTKFGGVANWDVDSTLNGNTYNFHTVIYHEIMHALGFRGFLPSVIPMTNIPITHGTFDENTYKNNTTTTINDFLIKQPTSNLFKNILQVATGAPSPWFINNTDTYQGIRNTIPAITDGIRPIFSPGSWQQGSSLSHFDMTRAVPKVYVMNPGIPTNTVRPIHMDEEEVLCHLGYEVLGLNGCTGATPVANNDSVSVLGTGTVPVPTCVDMLSNDSSFSGGSLSVYSVGGISIQTVDTLAYYSGTGCTGTSSSVFAGAQSVQLTPSTSLFSRSLLYTVSDSVSHRVSFPAMITFSAASCSSNPNEFVCNGGFEEPFVHDAWYNFYSGVLGEGLFEAVNYCTGVTCSVPFWTSYFSSDIFSSLSNFYSWFQLPQGPLTSPNGGNSVSRQLVGKGDPNIFLGSYVEILITQLKNPLTVGQHYQVSFDTLASVLPNPPYSSPIDLNITSPKGCIGLDTVPPSYLNQSSVSYAVTPTIYNFCQNLTLATIGSSPWTHVSYTLTPTLPYQYLTSYGDFQTVSPNVQSLMSVFFDNLSIVPVPVTPNTISGTVYQDANSNGVQNTNELGLNGVQVGLFDSTSTTPTVPIQITTTNYFPANQNITNPGSYTFTGVPNGSNYYVAMMPENIYQSITQPVYNSIFGSYYHVYHPTTVSGGNTYPNQNFGVTLNANLPDLIMTDNIKWTGTYNSALTVANQNYGTLPVHSSTTNPYVSFRATVKNIGTAPMALNNTSFKLYKNSILPANIYGQITFGNTVQLPIAPNATQTIYFTSAGSPNLRAIPGTFNIFIKGDTSNTIAESNENNNESTPVSFVVN